MKLNHWEKEWAGCIRRESAYLNKNYVKKENWVQKNFSEKIPDQLNDTLYSAFSISFRTILEKGSLAIEKTMNLDELEKDYKINSYAYDLKQDAKTLRKFSTQAKLSNLNNVIFSGVKGASLGVLGIGLPDIPILITSILRGIYKVSAKYGYEFNTPAEQFFILTIIQTAFASGRKLENNNTTLNEFIQNYTIPASFDKEEKIDDIAQLLSAELIAIKFVQGVPLVGAVGGIYDAFFVDRVLKYANLKYNRRFLLDKAERVD